MSRGVPDDLDIVLPAQFNMPTAATNLYGERRLMLAILADAIDCLQGGGPKPDRITKRNIADDRAWVRSRDDKWTFSFENVCQTLDIPVGQMRAALLSLGQGKKKHVLRQMVRPRDQILVDPRAPVTA